jgi:hypothetical protein
MKMGTIVSPWRYDAGAFHARQLIILRLPVVTFAMPNADADTAYDPRRGSQKLHFHRTAEPMGDGLTFGTPAIMFTNCDLATWPRQRNVRTVPLASCFTEIQFRLSLFS